MARHENVFIEERECAEKDGMVVENGKGSISTLVGIDTRTK